MIHLPTTFLRRAFVTCLTAGLTATSALADTYPSRPITIVTPTAAGGGTDLIARLVADKLSPVLGQAIVVDNKPGAGGTIGNQYMIRENNDGYSLFVTANSNQLILPWIVKNAGFDPIKDYEPVAGLGVIPYVLAVHPSFEATNLKEFLQLLKQRPGELYYASAGVGTLNHLIPEMLASEVSSKMEHVPYRGVAPAMTDVLGGQVPIMFGSLSSVLENIKSGKLRALAVTSNTRQDLLPDIPAIAEIIPDFNAELWVAMYAPAGTPKSIVNKLANAVETALNTPETKEQFTQLGMSLMNAGPEELALIQEREFALWGEVVKTSGANAQ